MSNEERWAGAAGVRDVRWRSRRCLRVSDVRVFWGWRKTRASGSGDRGAHRKGVCVPSSV
ncbi:MAG: hypothetical protein LBK25_01305 [Treponema sp.]|nr:hypothetical protein [Treponema sp.]